MRLGIHIRLPMLRAGSVLGAAALVLAVALHRESLLAGEALEPTGVPAAATIARARALFNQRCVRCHDHDGMGGTLRRNMPALPNFTSSRWQHQRSDTELVVSILEGRGTQMPAFGHRLCRVEARALVAHIRAFAPQEMASITESAAEDFQERFRALQEEFARLREQFDDLRSVPE